ncbi:MAG: response regulator [Desulfobacterales bacterium]|nr:response regulator [Desulfobacterales bacterium]
MPAGRKGLELTCLVHHRVPSGLYGDPGRLRQILLNLVGNAIKFTNQGQVILRVILDGESERKVQLRFEVQDTDIGIPRERMDRLFRSFSQVDVLTSRRFGGTGLGLAISKKLVELMGGQIGVKSETDKGALFWFTLICEKREVVWADLIEKNVEGLRILLAEDNAINRLVALNILKKFGYRAHVVSNGKEAVETLRKAEYHLVLMDLEMPVMDGFAATGAIRDTGTGILNPNVPIIAMTAHEMTSGYRDRCLSAGMNDFTTKPVDPQALLSVIERWTEAGRSADGIPKTEKPESGQAGACRIEQAWRNLKTPLTH